MTYTDLVEYLTALQPWIDVRQVALATARAWRLTGSRTTLAGHAGF